MAGCFNSDLVCYDRLQGLAPTWQHRPAAATHGNTGAGITSMAFCNGEAAIAVGLSNGHIRIVGSAAGTRHTPFNSTPMGVSTSFDSPHVRPMGVCRTCGA